MDLTTKTEEEFVSSLLNKPSSIIKIIDKVKAEDIAKQEARQIFLAIISLWREKKDINLVSICNITPEVVEYASQISGHGVLSNPENLANLVAKNAKQRRVERGMKNIVASKSDTDSKLSEMLRLYQDELSLSAKDPRISKVISRLDEKIVQNKERGAMGVDSGLEFLNHNYTRYTQGHIWLIGGFTSTGKTAMMIQKVRELLDLNDSRIMIVSTEMTEEQLVARIISNYTGIHTNIILSGRLRSAHEEENVANVKKMLQDRELLIYDDIYHLHDIQAAFMKADLQGGVDVGIIDYVQNCKVEGATNEYQEQSVMAKGLQRLAKDSSCCLICLSQVSNSKGRGDVDQLEYKGAGEWAAVADVGIMLKRKKSDSAMMLYDMAKNRHGATTQQVFEYRNNYTSLAPVNFEDVEN